MTKKKNKILDKIYNATKKKNKILDKIYLNISNPEGLGSMNDLYKKAKTFNCDISKKDVNNYLLSKESYTLFKRNPQNFSRRCMQFKKPGNILVCDTMFLKPFNPQTKNPYLMIAMDGFSRFVHTFPLKNLKMHYVSAILENFLKNNIFSYNKVFSDSGSEFSGKTLLKMYARNGISWYTTHSANKTSLVERFIKTLKIKVSKNIIQFNKLNVDEAIPHIVESYNLRVHSSLVGLSPIEVHLAKNWSEIKKISIMVNKQCFKRIKPVKIEHQPNTVVRLRIDDRNIFSNRAHNIVNTPELFVILKKKRTWPVTYKVGELDNRQPLVGAFYHNELVPALDSGLYKIQILNQKRVGKKLMYRVAFLNYPNQPDQWMSANQLETLS